MLTDEQKKLRMTGIGSSDIAAVVGLHPYRSALDVWAVKRGIFEEPDLKDKVPVQVGIYMEPFIAHYYAATTGFPLADGGGTHTHPDHPWMLATPDREVPRYAFQDYPGHLVELKTVGWRSAYRWGEGGEDVMPPEYQVQCRWQMAVRGTGAISAH